MSSAPPSPTPEKPARMRLLREFERGGASGEFLRQYFLCRRELTADDLRAVWQAVSTSRLSATAPTI